MCLAKSSLVRKRKKILKYVLLKFNFAIIINEASNTLVENLVRVEKSYNLSFFNVLYI